MMQPEYSQEHDAQREANRSDDALQYPRGMRPPSDADDPSGPEAQPRMVRVPIRLPDRQPIFTYILLGLIVAVYLLGQVVPLDRVQVVKGYAVNTAEDWLFVQGAKINTFILQDGEVYRLLTAMFLHGGLAHLFFNGYALYVIGRGIERLYGHTRFLIIYFLAGLTGSVASLVFSPAASVGASGALFGIFGAEMVFLYRNRKLFGSAARARLNNLLMLLALNLVIGITPGSNIDNWGHVGGLVGGLALSWLIGPIFQPVQPTLGATAIDLRDTNPLEGPRLFVPFAALAALVLVVGVMTMTA
jgi:rhomboid protease GluP